MKKKTVGKVATELQQKETGSINVVDQQRSMQEDYMSELLKAVDAGYKIYPNDFFIHVETKSEKLLSNVVRNYFIHRFTCPTPNYDQTVFKYDRSKGQIEYIWTIPDRETAHHLLNNSNDVVQEEKELLFFVMKFANGDLYRLCKKLNNEKDETPELKETNGNSGN
jgi:hypothetical protein